MDAFKIIKKHGVPAGLPVVTVYVDPDAPGESGNTKLFLHIVESAANSFAIITKDETPFTSATFAKFLYDRNLRSQDHFYPASRTRVQQYGENIVRVSTNIGLYSSNGTITTLFNQQNDLSVNGNILVCSSAIITSGSVNILNDIVTEI